MLLGLHGNKRSGKSTAAQLLWNAFPTGFKEAAFATPLKQAAAALLGVDQNTLEYLKATDYAYWTAPADGGESFNMRTFLQRMGTEVGRSIFGPDFWLDLLLPPPGSVDPRQPVSFGESISFGEYLDPEGPLYVITDVRFPNEALRIKELGGVVIRIERPALKSSDSHRSETPLPRNLYHSVVYNYENELENFQLRLVSMVNNFIKENGI